MSPALAGRSFTTELPGKPIFNWPSAPWALGVHVIDSILIDSKGVGQKCGFFHFYSNYLDFYVKTPLHHTDMEI